MSTQNRTLTVEPIPKLLRMLAVPAALGFLFNTLYNVVDTWVAGQVSAEALAALSLSFPVFFILIAIGMGMGNGMTALIGTEIGADNKEKTRLYTAQSISLGFFLALFLAIAGYYLSPALFVLLGASESYLATALSYMQPLFIGSVFMSMAFTFNAILNAIGDTISYRNFLIAGFFANLLLSPWLAFGWLGVPALGIFGIALATILVNLAGAIYLGAKVCRAKLLCWADLQDNFKPKWKVYKDIIGQGLPASFSMMTVALGAFIITYFVSKFGPDAVAGYGTALRIEQLVLIPGIGINIAVLTLISQNNGAKLPSRVKETVKVGLRYTFYIGIAGTVFLFLLAEQLMRLFTDSTDIIAFGGDYLLIAAFMTWAYGILFVVDSALRGLKRPIFPLVIGVLRQVVLPWPLFWIMTVLLSFSIVSIWWSIFAVVWTSAVVSWWYLWRVMKNYVLLPRKVDDGAEE